MNHSVIFMKKQQKTLFTIVIEKTEEGYFVYCPQLQGCYSQGETREEALKNIKEAIGLHIEDRIASGETWVEAKDIQVTALEIKV